MDYFRQLIVVEDIAAQLESATTSNNIVGIMLESNLVAGASTLATQLMDGLS